MALDSFPFPAKECWRWRCSLVWGFVCFVLNRNTGVKKYIFMIHSWSANQASVLPEIKIQNSVFDWNRVDRQSMHPQHKKYKYKWKYKNAYWWNRLDLQSRHRWLTERRQTNPRSLVPTQLPWSTNTNTFTNTNTKKIQTQIHTRSLLPTQSPW